MTWLVEIFKDLPKGMAGDKTCDNDLILQKIEIMMDIKEVQFQ